MTTTPIHVPYDDAPEPTLRVELGACRLRVSPGGQDAWVQGSYTDPSDEIPLRIDQTPGRVTIGQARTFQGAVGLFRGTPSAELVLGTARPFRLELSTGASDTNLVLGGVPLRGLELRAGAGRVHLTVDTPNPTEAGAAALRVGAGGLDATGLGNLAATRLDVESGAAGLELDLTGELRLPLDVRISSGMSGIKIVVPAERPVRITTASTLGGTDIGDGFHTVEGAIRTLAEGTPVLTVHATVALGGLALRTR